MRNIVTRFGARGRLLAMPAAFLAFTLFTGTAFAAWLAIGFGLGSAQADQVPQVSQLVVESVLGGDVELSWAAVTMGDSSAVDGYDVDRYADGSTDAETVAADCDGQVATTGCTEQGVPEGKWRYTVTAAKGLWAGPASGESAIAHVVTRPPTNVAANALSQEAIQVTWTNQSDIATGYRVERSADGVGGWLQLGSNLADDVETVTHSGLACDESWYYRVIALNATNGNSVPSNIPGVTTLACDPVPGVPAAPTNLVADAVSTTQIDLAWDDNATDETGYRIERSADGTTWSTLDDTLAPGTEEYSDTGVPCGEWHYRVFAVNAEGDSAPSNTAIETAQACPTPTPNFLVEVAAGNKTAGTAFNVTLTARDNGTVDTTYTGGKSISFSGPGNSPNDTAPIYPATVTFMDGVGVASVTLYKAETATLHATEGARTGSTAVTVTPAANRVLRFTSSSHDCASGTIAIGGGQSFSSKVSVFDPYGNGNGPMANTTVSVNRQGPGDGPGTTGNQQDGSVQILANQVESSDSFTYKRPTQTTGNNGHPAVITASVTGWTDVTCTVTLAS